MSTLLFAVPIISFFIIFKFQGLAYAIMGYMGLKLVHFVIDFFTNKKINYYYLGLLLIAISLGGLSIYTNNNFFFMHEISVVYISFFIMLFVSTLFGYPILNRFIPVEIINLKKSRWKLINFIYAILILTIGLFNVYIVYNYDLDFWVNYRVFGVLLLLTLFSSIVSLYFFSIITRKK